MGDYQEICHKHLPSLHTDPPLTGELWDASCHGVHWFEVNSHCALLLSDIFKMLKWNGTDHILFKMKGQTEIATHHMSLLMLDKLPVLELHQRQYPFCSYNSKQNIYLYFLLQV